MPTYDYKCGACKHTYEMFQAMSEPPKRRCPKCGKNTAERLIGTGAGVLFKGSGFYQTDYRSESYKKGAEADSKSTKADTKTESKADAKSESKTGPKAEPKAEKKASGESPSKPRRKKSSRSEE